MCRCLESCNIIVKKYSYDTVLFEEVETELKEIPIENNVTNVDGISLLNELQTKQNANEMLEYIESIRDLLSEEIYSLLEKTLKTRWDMERMYGTNKKSTIAVLERILIS